MSYQFIENPYNGRMINIYSNLGKTIVNNYINHTLKNQYLVNLYGGNMFASSLYNNYFSYINGGGSILKKAKAAAGKAKAKAKESVAKAKVAAGKAKVAAQKKAKEVKAKAQEVSSKAKVVAQQKVKEAQAKAQQVKAQVQDKAQQVKAQVQDKAQGLAQQAIKKGVEMKVAAAVYGAKALAGVAANSINKSGAAGLAQVGGPGPVAVGGPGLVGAPASVAVGGPGPVAVGAPVPVAVGGPGLSSSIDKNNCNNIWQLARQCSQQFPETRLDHLSKIDSSIEKQIEEQEKIAIQQADQSNKKLESLKTKQEKVKSQLDIAKQ